MMPTDTTLRTDPLDSTAPVRERLTTTLFLAALLHGIVILGITFAAPKSPPATPTLEVLLLTGADTRAADNPAAQYLAQRNQAGSGTTEAAVRPANPASSMLPLQQAGIVDGNGVEYREATAGALANEYVTSRSDRSEVSYRSGETEPAAEETPLALAPTAVSPIATNTPDTSLRLRGRHSGKYEVVPNTRASIIAPYLDAWRRKVERLGTLNFPQVAKHAGTSGNPVLEMTIRADGKLSRSVVRRSSGHKELDQAALSILRLASPFDPFPSEVRKKYDELRFAYEWQFLGGGSGSVAAAAQYATEAAHSTAH